MTNKLFHNHVAVLFTGPKMYPETIFFVAIQVYSYVCNLYIIWAIIFFSMKEFNELVYNMFKLCTLSAGAHKSTLRNLPLLEWSLSFKVKIFFCSSYFIID